jgi:glycosyltransferase involved in cell wall biosynthesis
MSDRPAVTVALPVFNGRALVAEAIDSVLGQKGWDLHLVVVDDGSSDGSGDLLSERAAGDARIEVIRLPTNCGVAHARNVAVAARQDPLVAFIDQDDRWRPDRLDVGWRALSCAPELDYVLAHQVFERPTGDLPPWVRERWLEGPQQGHVFGTLLAWRDRAWNAVGPLDETLRFGLDDVDWFARAQDLGLRQAMLPDVLLERGLHAGNASARTREGNAELVAVLRAKLQRHDRGEEVAQ